MTLPRFIAAAATMLMSLGGMLAPAEECHAEDGWPAKPIRFILGFPPGGGNDVLARILSAKFQETFGKPIIVDNRPGADGIIAAELVAHAAPDGYTLLIGSTAQMTMNPVLYPGLSYDPRRDFAPIGMIGRFPVVLVVAPSLPVKSAAEFITYARGHTPALNYSAGSSAFQFVTESFRQRTGIEMVHVPYKGSAQAANAVLAGDTDLTFVDSPAVVSFIQSGRLHALAVTTPARVSTLPGVPTLAEQAVPGFEFVLWSALFAPAHTPAAVLARLQQALARTIVLPDVRERLAASGILAGGGGADELADSIGRYIDRNAAVAKAANLKPQQ